MKTSEIATDTGFRPYVCRPSSVTREQIQLDCNQQMDRAYGPSMKANQPVAFPMLAYQQLLAALTAMPHIEITTLGDLCARPYGEDRVRLAIRHDVDGDIVAALQMADVEHRHGARSSYYFLHTARYHGYFSRGCFNRHEAVAGMYRQVQALGHEVGLHTDGLTVYREYGIDGAMAVRQELQWMREQGIDVQGTVAHGSKAAFGAENYEIFRGRHRGAPRNPAAINEPPDKLDQGSVRGWLRVLDEQELGLCYEGNDIFFQSEVPVQYGATRTVDGWRWNAYRRRNRGIEHPVPSEFCCQELMLRDIDALEPGCCVVLAVHPCYYGARHDSHRWPVTQLDNMTVAVNEKLGWNTYVAGEIQACADHDRQSINCANRLGMLDVQPPSVHKEKTVKRIIFVDGGLLDGREVATPSHADRVVERMLQDDDESVEVQCMKLAHRGLGIARRWPWLMFALQHNPDIVILGITTQEVRWSMPKIWSRETGFSQYCPPGDYLEWRDNTIVEVSRSRGWAIRQRDPVILEHWPGSDLPITNAMATDDRIRLDGVNAHRALMEIYVHCAQTVKKKGAACMLMVTDCGELADWRALPPDAKRLRMKTYQKYVRQIAKRMSVPLIDPSNLLGAPPESEQVHNADGTWTAEAHRLIAKLLYQELQSSH
jgi:hypothetical protein